MPTQLRHDKCMKYATMGTEFSATIGVMLFLGYWLDNKFDCSPFAMIAGLILGFIAGMYSLLKQAKQARKDFDSQAERNRCRTTKGDST